MSAGGHGARDIALQYAYVRSDVQSRVADGVDAYLVNRIYPTLSFA